MAALPAAPGGRASSPTTRSATCSWWSTAGARCARSTRTWSSPSPTWPPGAWATASTWSLTAARWAEIRSTCGTCSAPGWSCGSATRPTPRSTAGRRRTCRRSARSGPHPRQAALPHRPARGSTASADVEDLAEAPADLVEHVRGRPGRAAPAPQVRLLPRDAARGRAGPGRRPAGAGHADRHQRGGPARRSTSTSPASRTSMVFGDAECGKTNLLRLIARGIIERYTPGAGPAGHRRLPAQPARRGRGRPPARVRAVEPGRSARGSGRSAAALQQPAARPGRDHRRSCATAAGGRARSCTSWSTTTTWWPPAAATRCSALLELLPQARDIGLHLVLTRRVGGAARALVRAGACNGCGSWTRPAC